ncbi:hypothetical protein D6779_00035 [Candidatus Parcubacteria bacterium]|nr:MAG: hypothetical protein D6779_00035 [Candidatus Parcubacteria bacterium]
MIDYSEDYRSAFLRAGSVNEIVMLARVVSLVSDEQDKSSLLDALDQRTPEARRVFKALVQPDKTYIDVQKDIPFKGAPGLQISRPSIMQPWWKKTKMFSADDGWDTFLTRRNELIHKFFSVPREWAEDAWRFVQANFEDFLGHPLEGLNLRAKALSWPELCTLTGIDQFLPPNLRKEA